MEMNYLKYSLPLLTLAMFAVTPATCSPAKEFVKTITEEFDIRADGTVQITNRYGDIDVQTWDQSRVQIEVTITVDSRNQQEANESFERIQVNFDNSPSHVSAATEISTITGWKKWFDSSSDKFEIDYVIRVPATVELELDNKYGDIYVMRMENDADIVLKYGNLRLDGFNGDVDLELAYGKGSLTSANDLNLELSYSTLRCGELGDLTIDSKYSNFEVESVSDIRSNSGYDNYKVELLSSFDNVGKFDDIVLGKVSSVEIETKYSNLLIEELLAEADLRMKYGAAKIKHVTAGFSNIEIESNYTAVSIDVADDADFLLDVYARHCGVRASGVEYSFEKRSSSETELKGHRGSRNAAALISANMEYGSLTVN